MSDNVTLSEFFGKKMWFCIFIQKTKQQVAQKKLVLLEITEELTNLGAEVIGVSGQSVESHKSFASHYGLQFILLSDEGNNVRGLYGVPSNMSIIPGRGTYIIDKKGMVRHIFNSQTQSQKHVEEAKKTLLEIEKEENGTA